MDEIVAAALEGSLSLARHPLSKDFVDPAQMAVPLRLEPIQYFIIDSKRDLSLERAIVFADYRVAPIFGTKLRRIRIIVEPAISFPVSFLRFFSNLQPPT